MNGQLPIVLLQRRFHQEFGAFLKHEIKRFVQEEGGYLIGKFLGEFIEVHGFYHDKLADRTVGDIKLSSEAYDEASQLVGDLNKSGNPNLSIIGTWHTHPPGYGVRYSSIDVDTLFVDRMVLNALDPGEYQSPQIHMIISGYEFEEMAVYTLSLRNEHRLVKMEGSLIDKHILTLPANKSQGILVNYEKKKYFSISNSSLQFSIRQKKLIGFWRLCDPEKLNLKWEAIFVENFLRNILNSQDGEENHTDIYTYCRLIPESDDKISIQRYEFTNPGQRTPFFFESLHVVPEDVSFSINLESAHPEGQSINCEISSTSRISDLTKQVQEKLGLYSPPVLWTLLKPESVQYFKKFAKVDEFGKTFLPDDLNIFSVLKRRATQETPIYWESTSLNPQIVRQLRLYRFEQMGYQLETLAQSHVLIAGLGILGCEIASLLGTLNVGQFTLLDNGRIDWVNIYRQSLYKVPNVGELKVDAASRYLEELGSQVNPLSWSIPSTLITDVISATRILVDMYTLIQDVDIVIGSLDSFSTRAVLQVLCRILQKPFLSASLDYLPSLAITQGSVTSFHPASGRCYGCGSNINTQVDRGACTHAPIEFPKIVGGIATKVAVDILSEEVENQAIEYKIYNDYRIEKTNLGHNAKGCKLCSIAKETEKKIFIPRIIHWLLK